MRIVPGGFWARFLGTMIFLLLAERKAKYDLERKNEADRSAANKKRILNKNSALIKQANIEEEAFDLLKEIVTKDYLAPEGYLSPEAREMEAKIKDVLELAGIK